MGRLAPFHHVFEPPPEVARAAAAAYRRVAPGAPASLPSGGSALDLYQPLFTKIAGAIREVGGFSEPEQWRFDWDRVCTRDEWLDQLPTTGLLTRLPPGKLAEVLADTGAAIDALGGSVTVRYATVAVTAARARLR